MAKVNEEYMRTDGAEALAEVLVCAHGDDVAKEGHNDRADGGDDGDNMIPGTSNGPVSRKGGSGIGDEGDAGDDGGQQRHSDRPAGD